LLQDSLAGKLQTLTLLAFSNLSGSKRLGALLRRRRCFFLLLFD
jgi:hypothetical protein